MYKAIKNTSSKFKFFLDLEIVIRRLLSLIPLAHIFLLKKNQVDRNSLDQVVIFLYGGLGDLHMQFHQIKLFSVNRINILLIVNKKFEDIVKLNFPDSKIITYENTLNIFSVCREVNNHIKKNSIFIFNSPIIEVYLIFILLNIKIGIGIIASNSFISSIGVESISTPLKTINKYEIFNKIYYFTADIFGLKKDHEFQLKRNQPSNYLIVNVNKTNTWPAGKWSKLCYIKLIDYLQTRGLLVYLIGDISERDYVNSIFSALSNSDGVINIAGYTSITQLNQLIRAAQFVVTGDTGIMHMASWNNVPTFSLFSFSDPNTFAWGNFNFVIQNKTLNCMPCIGHQVAPIDNYPFKCPHKAACDQTISFDVLKREIDLYLVKNSF